jgi:hypothetical protein
METVPLQIGFNAFCDNVLLRIDKNFCLLEEKLTNEALCKGKKAEIQQVSVDFCHQKSYFEKKRE